MFDFLPASNTISQLIIIATFIFLIFITARVISQNITIFNRLKRELDLTYQSLPQSNFWQDLKTKYDQENENKNNHIDVQAFVESYMSSYSAQSNNSSTLSTINRIQSTGSTAILIGVLGTFVGLIIALAGLDIGGDQFQNSIQNVLDGIYTAFYTSVFGIIASLVIAYCYKNWDAKHLMLQLTLRAENLLQAYAKHTWESRMVDSLSRVKDAIEDMHQSLKELDQFSDTMEKASENMNAYNERFEQSATVLHETFHNMETVGENFNERMDQLNRHFDTLVGAVTRQDDALQAIDGSIKHLTEDVTTFVTGSTKHLEGMTKENSKVLMDVSKKVSEGFQGMTSFYNQNIRQLDRITESVSQVERKNEDYISSIGKATETIQELLRDRTFDQLLQTTQRFTENVMVLENYFIRLQDQYERMEKERKDFASFSSGQKDELARIRDEINKFSSHNEGIRRQFEEIKYGFEQADRSNRELVQAAYELTRDLKDVLQQASGEQAKQMKQVVYDFQNQLNDAFRNLDAIIGKNLSNSIQQFEQYVSNTNQAIERQFQAVNQFVQNNVNSNNTISRDILHSVDDMRGRINQWDQQMRQSIRTKPQREYIE